MSFTKRLAAGVLFSLGLAGSPQAATLFQSIPDLTVNPTLNAWCSACGGAYQVYDTFTIGSASAIGSVSFAVQTSFFFPTDIEVSIWSVDGGGAPGAQLLSQTFTTGQFVSVVNTPFDTSIVTVNPTSWSLASGMYDISFYADNLGVPAYAGGAGLLYQEGFGFYEGDSAAFSLDDTAMNATTPVPAALPLLLTGLGALGLVGRRRKRQAAA